ncbi:MAG: RidA family protein [Acidobacteria bacterium]|nr:RidA family protein [Acidobacteriota bacterium]
MLLLNPKGNYWFLKGISPYSAGVVSDEGYEIVHATFLTPQPMAIGFDQVKAHLQSIGRPLDALCAMELRSPKPFTFDGFIEFNGTYLEVLKSWGLLLDGLNPVARTNIAPAIGAPSTPCIYAFSYTIPSQRKEKSFIVAGAGELPEGTLKAEDVIRKGETSNEALAEKTRFVMGLMTARLTGLGLTWAQVTTTEVYTIHPMTSFLENEIITPMGASAIHGITWHYSRPPIETIEYELDLRGCFTEIVL